MCKNIEIINLDDLLKADRLNLLLSNIDALQKKQLALKIINNIVHFILKFINICDDIDFLKLLANGEATNKNRITIQKAITNKIIQLGKSELIEPHGERLKLAYTLDDYKKKHPLIFKYLSGEVTKEVASQNYKHFDVMVYKVRKRFDLPNIRVPKNTLKQVTINDYIKIYGSDVYTYAIGKMSKKEVSERTGYSDTKLAYLKKKIKDLFNQKPLDSS